jgi:GTP cyclohydrolase II
MGVIFAPVDPTALDACHVIEECTVFVLPSGEDVVWCGVVIYFRKEGRSLGEVTKYSLLEGS